MCLQYYSSWGGAHRSERLRAGASLDELVGSQPHILPPTGRGVWQSAWNWVAKQAKNVWTALTVSRVAQKIKLSSDLA